MALAEVHRRVLGGPEEGAGHIAVDHKAVGVGRTAVVEVKVHGVTLAIGVAAMARANVVAVALSIIVRKGHA